jgi:hypothetical protein
MVHAVKAIRRYFEDVISGQKPFEVRKHDRDYKVNDLIALNEHDPEIGGCPDEWKYTGRSALFRISYVLNDPEYCKDGYVVLGIKPCSVGGTVRGDIPIIYGGERTG